MKKNKVDYFKNIYMVFGAGALSVIVSSLVGFLIPYFFSVEEYSIYKIYTIYIAYSGLLHFGIINGIYLKYGKYSYDELPRERFRGYFINLLLIQIMSSAVLVGLVLIIGGINESVLVYIFIGVNAGFINLNCYFSLLNQFTKRFNIDCLIQVIQNILWVIVCVLIITKKIEYAIQLLVFVSVINIVCFFTNLFISKDICIGKADEQKTIFREVKELSKTGIVVMLSELVGLILLGIDAIFVQFMFDIYDFAMYTFAISIVNVVYAFISYLNSLFYPYMVRIKDFDKVRDYLYDFVSFIGSLTLSTYYLASILIKNFFEKYADSIIIIKLLYVTVLFKIINMWFFSNLCKIKKENGLYLTTNIIVLCVSIVLNAILGYVYGTTKGIAVASIISIIVWYLLLDVRLVGKIDKIKLGRYIKIIMVIALFFVFDNPGIKEMLLFIFCNIGIWCVGIIANKKYRKFIIKK